MNKIKKETIRHYDFMDSLESYESTLFNENGVVIEKNIYNSGDIYTDGETLEKHKFQDGKLIKIDGLGYFIKFDYYENGFNKSEYSTSTDNRTEMEIHNDNLNEIELSMSDGKKPLYTEYDHLLKKNYDKIKKINTLISTEQTILNKQNNVESIEYIDLKRPSSNKNKLFYYNGNQNLTKVILKYSNYTEITEHTYSPENVLFMTKITTITEDFESITFDVFFKETKGDNKSIINIKKHYQICSYGDNNQYYIKQLKIETKSKFEEEKKYFITRFDSMNDLAEIDSNDLLDENDIINFNQLVITDKTPNLSSRIIKKFDRHCNLTIEKEYLNFNNGEELNYECLYQNIYNLEDFRFRHPAEGTIKLKSVINFYVKKPSNDRYGHGVNSDEINSFISSKEYEYYY